MPQRRFPRPGNSSQSLAASIDANGLALAHVYGQPPAAIAFPDKRLTDDEAESFARLIVRLPELVELERDRNKANSRRQPHRTAASPVTIGDLAREGKLLEVECSACRPSRHLYIEPLSLGLPKQLPVPDVANHLVSASVAPGMTNSNGRYTRGRMPEFQGSRDSSSHSHEITVSLCLNESFATHSLR